MPAQPAIRAVFCDAETDRDIEAIARAALAAQAAQGVAILPVDPGPFTATLVRLMREPHRLSPLVFGIVGSMMDTSRQQMDFVEAGGYAFTLRYAGQSAADLLAAFAQAPVADQGDAAADRYRVARCRRQAALCTTRWPICSTGGRALSRRWAASCCPAAKPRAACWPVLASAACACWARSCRWSRSAEIVDGRLARPVPGDQGRHRRHAWQRSPRRWAGSTTCSLKIRCAPPRRTRPAVPGPIRSASLLRTRSAVLGRGFCRQQ